LWLEAVALTGSGTATGPRIVAREGEARGWPAEDDLFLAAVRLALDEGGGGPAADFAVRSEIPVGRGFGSSGAAVAAGLLLGAALAHRPPSLGRLHALGVGLEGHPDNVTAALFGGLTLCHPHARSGAPLFVHQELAPELGLVLAWSDQALATSRARAVLPAAVAFADAVENARRLPLLLAGLRTADRELVRAGGEDRLHVPYRLPLITGGAAALAAAREAGAWLATVSGAGSGLVALGLRTDLPAIAAAMHAALEREASGARARIVEPVREAPCPVRGSPAHR
jgi:homoserine kinase